MREFYDSEIQQIRTVLHELIRAEKRDDILGRFASGRLRLLSIPVILWAEGHDLD